ncbi:SpaA isopeptide-forming pilin-related protein (plasmid) [Lactococcus garvieae]|uniref:SpaA isopeptide-forming pilin-related protein n=1 Tax=Lactococcus garvieae TaxID=1363 RepID=UPI00311B4358
MKKQHKLNKLVQALTEKKVTHFSMRKSGKRWMTRSAIVLALAGGTGIVATVNPSIFSTIVHALTLPSGSTQIGSIGKAPVIQTDNNSFASMQPLFDAIIGTNQPSFILGDTIDGTGGKAIGWNSNTSLSDSWLTISDADNHTSGASGLSYQTIHYGLGTADGYQDSDKYNYISSKGQTFKVKNVGTAYDTKTKKNVPVSMEVKVNGATYYDSESSSTPRDVFGDGFRLLVAARNNNGNITLGYMVSMDGIPNPGSGQGNEGGGSGGGTGEAIGAASGIPESVNATITMYREDTKENLPEDTLMAMKVSDVDAGQAANVSTNGVHGFIVSKPTNLEIKDNVLTAKGNDTVVNDPKNLSANSYIALKSDNSFFLNFKDSNGNQKQGSIIEALFGNMGPVSPREPLGYISIDKSTDGFDKNPWNENYGFDKLEFEVIDKDGKVVDTIKLDKNGKGKSIGLPPGDYKLHEKSTDWSSTGQTVRPDETTAVSAGDTTTVKLKNKVVVGQNTLEKTDKDTGLEQNGKGVLKTAKYAYFYNDDSTGSSPHKKGDPVKWSDKPGPKLLEGEKVSSAIIGGETVDFGDNVVIDVADDSLKVALGNLPLGKFYSLEVDAGEGYVTDPTKHEFEIKETDPNTQNIVTPNTSSKEQLIKAKVAIEKMVTLPGSQGGSGYNGIEFTAEPMEGTVAEAVKFVTGVNPTTGDDGYASQELSYGDWKISETKGVEGYEDVEPVYIHMETDTEKDILTISASHNEDFSQPFSKRTFSLKDSSTGSNPNGEGTVGEVTPEIPTISLSTLHFNDNPETPKEPSIDIEKANDTLPNPGEGNHKDKDNNGGENDRDTPDTALEVEAGKTTAIKFRFTNNGTEALTHLKVSDKTIEGGISIKDPVWFFNGEKLSTNKEGELVTKDGKLLELKPDEFVTGEGTLPELSDGKLHGDEVTVGGIGVESGKEVGDEDKWYGKPPKEEPSIDIEKADSKAPEAGEGNHKDKPNNAGENDHDTDDTAKELEENKATEIFFKTTNNGTEPLTHLKIVDKTIAGKVNVKNIKLTYKEKPLKVNKDGELTTEDGKLLVLNPGETIEGKGTLEGLAAGDIHGDNVTVDGVGVHSGKKVGDDDNWYGKVKSKPKTVIEKAKDILPSTGEERTLWSLAGLGMLLAALAVWQRDKLKTIFNKIKK